MFSRRKHREGFTVHNTMSSAILSATLSTYVAPVMNTTLSRPKSFFTGISRDRFIVLMVVTVITLYLILTLSAATADDVDPQRSG